MILASTATLSAKAAPAKGKPAAKKNGKTPVVELSPDLANEIYVVLEKGTRSPEMQTRALAVANIAIAKPESTKDYVEDALKDPQWIVRRSAIETLIKLGNPVYRKELARAVMDVSLYEGPLSPLPMLSTLPRQEAVDLLVEVSAKLADGSAKIFDYLLAHDRELLLQVFAVAKDSAGVKDYLMANLEKLCTAENVPIVDMLLDGLDKNQQLKVLEFFKNMEGNVPAPFIPRLAKSADKDINEAAVELSALRGDKTAAKAILPWCDSKMEARQLRCLRALRNLGTDKAVAEKAKMFLYGDPSPEVLYAAYDLLTRAGAEEIYDRVYKQINSTDTKIRAVSVNFLPRAQGNRCLPRLHDLLTDGNKDVKMGAVRGIGELRQVESVPILESALFDETDPELRREMVKSMGKIKDYSIIRPVSFLITDPTVKHEAVVALAGVPHRDALVTLENVLNNSYTKEERALALMTLIKISPAESAPVFQRSIGWLPEGFLIQLAKEMKNEVLPLVVSVLDSMIPKARLEAVEALKYMDPAKEKEILERELFATKYEDMKTYTIGRLCELKGAEMLPVLQSFFKDQDATVRIFAIRQAAAFSQPGTPDEDKIKDLLMDTSESARVAAASSLLQVYSKELVAAEPAAPVKPAPAKGKK